MEDVEAHVTVDPPVDRRASIRRATATLMEQSAAIPQFTLYRQLELNRASAGKGAESWTTVFVRALGAALRLHPEMNVHWADEVGARSLDAVRVGIAVDRPGVGLTVATVANPDTTDLVGTDEAVRRAVDRARSGRAVGDDLAPSGITLSNLGAFGVVRFNALLFPPQIAIMSIGAIAMRPVATGSGGLRAALTCEAGLTVDHRAADGADGARFLADFAHLVQRVR